MTAPEWVFEAVWWVLMVGVVVAAGFGNVGLVLALLVVAVVVFVVECALFPLEDSHDDDA